MVNLGNSMCRVPIFKMGCLCNSICRGAYCHKRVPVFTINMGIWVPIFYLRENRHWGVHIPVKIGTLGVHFWGCAFQVTLVWATDPTQLGQARPSRSLALAY